MALRAAASLVDALRHVPLLPPGQFDEISREASRFSEARALAQHLLQRGWLTPYQVNQLILERGSELILGQYVLLERLGDGARGQVFKARHRHMKRAVALKVIRKELLTDTDAVQRFYLEIQAASQLDHPNVVHAYDAGPSGPNHMLAMEYVKGTDLARLVYQAGPLSVPRACAYIAQAALGLQHAHERGLVHRDIKPSNLLVAHLPPTDSPRRDDSPESDSSLEEATRTTGLYEWGLVKILDFGLARLHRFNDDPNRPLTHEGAMVGTPDFMAPEQAADAHAVDIRADLYSLGCVFYFLLTGRPPFPGGSYIQKVDGHRWQQPEAIAKLRPEVSPEVAAVAERLMAKKPADRYQDPAEAAVTLAHLMGVPISGPPVPHSHSGNDIRPAPDESATLPIRPKVRKPRRPWLVGGAAVLAVILAGVATWMIRPGPKPALRTEPKTGTPAGDLERLIAQSKDGATDSAKSWSEFAEFRQRYPNTPEALQAAGWMLRIPSPFDRLDARTLLSNNRPTYPGPAELVAILGPERWRHWRAPIQAITYRPDGRVMATGDPDSDAFIWEAVTGRLLATLPGHKGGTRALVYSPNGKFLVSGAGDGTIHVWDAVTNRAITQVKSHVTGIRALAFSPDGNWVASSCDGANVHLRNPKAWKEFKGLKHPKGPILALAFAADSRTLATGNPDGTIFLWDMARSNRPQTILAGHSKPVSALAFGPKGDLLASGSEDNSLRLWEVSAQKEKWAQSYGSRLGAVAFLPGGVIGGAAGGSFRRWDTGNGKVQGNSISVGGTILALAVVPNRPLLAFAMNQPVVVQLDLQTEALAALPLGHRKPVRGVAFTPDGRTLLSAGLDQAVKRWDVMAGKEIASISPDLKPIHGLACSPDGQCIAVINERYPVVQLLDAAGKPRGELKGHQTGVRAVTFSPDGRMIATSGADETVRLWDLPAGKEQKQLHGSTKGSGVVFSPDGSLLAYASSDRMAKIYNLATRQEQATCKGHTGPVEVVMFSPDGRTLATGGYDLSIRLWDTASGQERAKLGGAAGRVTSLVFTPDGTLISASLEGRIVRQKPAVGSQQHEWRFPGPVYSLSLAADGRHLAAGNANGTVYIFRLTKVP